jgi:beta-glucosidase
MNFAKWKWVTAATIVVASTAATVQLAEAAADSATASSTANPANWPSPRWPITRDAKDEKRIAELLARMTVEEKVGQIVQADISAVTPDEVRKYHLGSVLNGGNSAPGGDEFAPSEKWLAMADAFYAASVDKSGGRTAIPVIWGTDAVHGHSNIVGATLFPHNIGLGAMRDPKLIEKIGLVTAKEIRTTGMEWTFAPTVTVPQDFRWGRAYEGYSSDPALVSSYVGRMIRGLQGPPQKKNLLKGPYVIASTKHFLADGGTFEGRDQGDARISETELRDIHGAPYIPAIEQSVATVMVSFSSWNGRKMTGNKSLITGVLKERMNFDGFVVSDWNAHGQVEGCTNASCPQAVNAGLDMYMAPDSWRDIYNSLLKQAKSGEISKERLDDAVTRILRVKMRLGLFEAGKPSSRPLAGQWGLLGHKDHRAIAREAVRKSLVLLKNEGGVLPLKPGARILVAGDAADDIGRQAGGWTLTWQGTGVTNAHFPGATSIWKGISDAAQSTGGSAQLSQDGSFSQRPDAAIVVFGETPYAEFQGDLKNLQLRSELRKPYEAMRNLKAQGIPVIAIMITGRPLFVNPELNSADAFVTAWLPGSEGGGVADVLFANPGGKPRYDFTGKLPVAWPATARHEGPTLFPFGYGLSYRTPSKGWTMLSEDSQVSTEDSSNVWMANGVPASSWSLRVMRGAGETTRVTTLHAVALDGDVRVSAVNTNVQEGGRRFEIGKGPATVEVSSHTPVDLTRETNGDVMLTMQVRFEKLGGGKIRLDMHGVGGTGSYDLTSHAEASLGKWPTIGIPLKCFAKTGADMTRIEAPFRLVSDGPATFSLSRISLGTVVDQTLTCP